MYGYFQNPLVALNVIIIIPIVSILISIAIIFTILNSKVRGYYGKSKS